MFEEKISIYTSSLIYGLLHGVLSEIIISIS